jgi:phage terminase large subunit
MHAEFVALITKWGLDQCGWSYIDRPPEIRFDGRPRTVYKGIQHAKDREKLKSVEGIDQVWIEEATEISKDDYDQIQLRVRSGNNNKIICSFNPIDSNSWLKREVEDKWQDWKSDSVWIEK